MPESINLETLLTQGMNAAALRQKTIAGNIANVDTPGFKAQAVRFEEMLRDAVASGDDDALRDIEAEVYQLALKGEHKGNNVAMEHELAQMIKNTTRYKVFMRLLAGKYRKIQMAFTGKPSGR